MTRVSIENLTPRRSGTNIERPIPEPMIELPSDTTEASGLDYQLEPATRPVTKSQQHYGSISDNGQSDNANVSLHSDKVRSTLPVQIAACRSLGKIGLSRKSLDDIKHLSEATTGWVNSIHRFLSDPDTNHLFPNGVPQIRAIHKLALFHDKPIRPPKRFICSTYSAFPKRRTPKIYRDALAQHRRISVRLAQFMTWIDMEALPISRESLEMLDDVIDKDTLNRYTGQRRRGINWFQKFLLDNTSIEEQHANGQLEVLREELTAALRFSEHVHFQRSLGPAFQGIDTNWRALHAYIEFSQSIHDVTQNRTVASNLIEHWQTSNELFYGAARKASKVSRRIRKLDKLIKRVQTLQLEGSDRRDNTAMEPGLEQRCNPDNPGVYLSLARNSTERLELWINMLTSGQNNGNLTPAEVLGSLKP